MLLPPMYNNPLKSCFVNKISEDYCLIEIALDRDRSGSRSLWIELAFLSSRKLRLRLNIFFDCRL